MSHKHDLTIRTRRDSDIAETAMVLVRVHAADGYPVEGVDRPEEWLTPPGMLKAWVAESAGKIVGHAAICRPNGEDAVDLWRSQSNDPERAVAVPVRLFVAPEARKKGIGEQLMRAVTQFGREQGTKMVFEVMTKDAAAIRLYERLGWVRLGATSHAYGDNQAIEAICFASPE
ncbi:N-acetyltransferase family protein [Streptomyces sp. NPDC001415]